MRKILLSALAIFLMFTSQSQWLVQNPGFTNDTLGFYEMSLPDKNTVWAVCYDGKRGLLSGRPVLDFTRTTNSGATWTPGKMGNDKTLRFSNISAINGEEAWVAMHKMDYSTIATLGYVGFGKGGGIFHTTDAGITWEHTEPGELFNENSTPEFVYFKDKNHGITVGDPNNGYWEIYLTNNKGKKWKRVSSRDIPVPLANERGWISGFAAVGNTIWFGTTLGRMYKSEDFGKSWAVHQVDPLPGTEVNEIAFSDDGLHGIAHLRNNTIFRTYVFSTSDGGLTWTNYFQPPNWKNSRVTAVPGTNAFVSTSVHPNPLFTGSSVSYDAGKTWTDIERQRQKAACRFYDANTGYAGGFFVTGTPLLGMFKSQIVFETASKVKNANVKSTEQIKSKNDGLVKIFPTPANDVVNVSLPDAVKGAEVTVLTMDGKIMQTGKSMGAQLIRVDVSKLPAGVYVVRVTTKSQVINKVVTIAR